MAMSRKDYESIADQFAREHVAIEGMYHISPVTREFMHAAIDTMASRIASIAYVANRNFKPERFFASCGMRGDLVEARSEAVRASVGFFGATLP